MMLDAALGLSRLVKEQDDMSWDNVDKVQAYIAKLKQHTDQLARQVVPSFINCYSSFNYIWTTIDSRGIGAA